MNPSLTGLWHLVSGIWHLLLLIFAFSSPMIKAEEPAGITFYRRERGVFF